MFLSVLIPTRNRARYLRFAVQSALNINSDEIEILVSENHSHDNSATILSEFSDPRLHVYIPQIPLAMHENWEFLLSKAKGEWVYFLGDDDAMMPHAVEHLRKVVARHPRVEAIVSPRAYYFWDGLEADYGGSQLKCNFSDKEVWRDSKKMLYRCLDGSIDYFALPQIYSGGFQRNTLINRIKRAQGGSYFKSVTPDAYSALVGVLHTFRYLEIGVPLAWIGTSPSLQSKHKGGLKPHELKDRNKDFYGMHSDKKLRLNFALGEFNNFTFTTCFYEAYTSAAPHINYDLLSQRILKKVFYDFCHKKSLQNDSAAIEELSLELGFPVPSVLSFDYNIFRLKGIFLFFVYNFQKIFTLVLRQFGIVQKYSYKASAETVFENILAFDVYLSKMYSEFSQIDRS